MRYSPPVPDPPFRGLRQFNCDEGRRQCGQKHRLAPGWTQWFESDSLADRLGRALSARCAIDMKELCEAFEFFERTRRRVRAPDVADLCCGHGLTGLLFALFERTVERVWLVDRVCPQSYATILEAVAEVGPWVRDKVRYLEMSVRQAVPKLPRRTSIIGVHACGGRTDQCIDAAVALDGALAIMPCCYPAPEPRIPAALREHLGGPLAIDVDRTYRLQRAGWRTRWTAIPRPITPMNRVIVGERCETQP